MPFNKKKERETKKPFTMERFKNAEMEKRFIEQSLEK
jgi:hypothetical protein